MNGQQSTTGMKKGAWSAEEDTLLISYVIQHGKGNWNAVQRLTGLPRCGKSCRLRWRNHLRPHLKKGEFTPDEEATVARLHWSIGNKWSLIASQLPGRCDNEVKNYWTTRVKRRQRAGLPLYSPEIPDLQQQQQQQQQLPNAGAVPVVTPVGVGRSAGGMALHAPPTAMPVGYGMMPPHTEVLPTYYATTELPSDQMGWLQQQGEQFDDMLNLGNPPIEQMEGNDTVEAEKGSSNTAGPSNVEGSLDTNPVIEDDMQTLMDMIATPSPPAPIPDWYGKDGGGESSN